MSGNIAGSRSDTFKSVGETVETPEHLGILLFNAVMQSALENKITSEDGKKLVVPIAFAIRPIVDDAHARGQTECYSQCFKVLGKNIICRRVCVHQTQTALDRHETLSDDALRARVKSGPPLADAARVEATLQTRVNKAATASEAGVIIAHSLATLIGNRSITIGDDGSADIDATAHVTVSERTPTDRAVAGAGAEACVESCITILDYEVVCFENCHVKVVLAS